MLWPNMSIDIQNGAPTKRSGTSTNLTTRSLEEDGRDRSHLWHTIKEEAKERHCSCIFEWIDELVEKVEAGNSLVDPYEVFKERLRIWALTQNQILYDDDGSSSEGSIFEDNGYKMISHLKKIEEQRRHIKHLQGKQNQQSASQPRMPDTPMQTISIFPVELQHPVNQFCKASPSPIIHTFSEIDVSQQPSSFIHQLCSNKCRISNQFNIQIESKQNSKGIFKHIIILYKQLFRSYLEAVSTCWKILYKLMAVVSRSLQQKTLNVGKGILDKIKKKLSNVAIWYGNLQIRVKGYTISQIEGFFSVCHQNLTGLYRSREDMDRFVRDIYV